MILYVYYDLVAVTQYGTLSASVGINKNVIVSGRDIEHKFAAPLNTFRVNNESSHGKFKTKNVIPFSKSRRSRVLIVHG